MLKTAHMLSPMVHFGENSVASRTPSGSIVVAYFNKLDLVVIKEGFTRNDAECFIERSLIRTKRDKMIV